MLYLTRIDTILGGQHVSQLFIRSLWHISRYTYK